MRWRGLDPNVLARRLEQTKEVGPEGELTFSGLSLRTIATALQGAVEFSEPIPDSHEWSIVYHAAARVARSGEVTSSKLLRAIAEGAEGFLRRPEEPFVLVTSLSVRHFGGLPREFELESAASRAIVSFDRFLSEPFRSTHEKARLAGEDQVIGRLPDPANVLYAYTPARVQTAGRSHQEAAQRALDALDLLRGIWNLAVNRGVGARTSIGIRQPVNKLALGPVHSLHHLDGRLADLSPWLEDDYVRPLHPYRLADRWDGVLDYQDFAFRRLPEVPYRAELEAGIRRYARALDKRDWNTSLVGLWSLMETLTGCYRNERVRARTMPLFKDEHKDFYGQILKDLDRHRNRTVHAGHEATAVETLTYALKRYPELLLEFHLSAEPAFRSIAEAGEFLESSNQAEVSRRIGPDPVSDQDSGEEGTTG